MKSVQLVESYSPVGEHSIAGILDSSLDNFQQSQLGNKDI